MVAFTLKILCTFFKAQFVDFVAIAYQSVFRVTVLGRVRGSERSRERVREEKARERRWERRYRAKRKQRKER